MNRSTNKTSSQQRGQVVTEYLMILTFVVTVLATVKIRVTPAGDLDLSGGDPSSETIMRKLSKSFTVWLQDIMIVIAFPS